MVGIWEVEFTLACMFDVHIFQAVARASNVTAGAYRPGDRYAMLVFIRQTRGTKHDWVAAESGVCEAGWSDVSFTRAGTLSAENLNGKGEDFIGAYESAMNGGCGLIVYSAPVAEDEE